MAQGWCDLLFAHWRVPVEALRQRIPERLQIDTFGGEAWIGVVPFRMRGIRPRFLPAVPWLSAFAELNLRTYVRLDDRPGVFFFSLDAANPVAVALARRFFLLPYFRARMQCVDEGDDLAYASRRTHPGETAVAFAGRYGPTGGVFHAERGTLEHFLTERYCLYASGASVGRSGDSLLRAEVHHAPWPLQPARAALEVAPLLATVGVESAAAAAPHLLFARHIDVRVWRPRKV